MSRAYCILSVLVVLALLLSACQPVMPQVPAEPQGLRPDAPHYALPGPYAVGAREFVIDAGDHTVYTAVWYPALNAEKTAEEITYTANGSALVAAFVTTVPSPLTTHGWAIKAAAPDATHGPYPLVILSIGLAGWRHAYSYLAEHLASYGFVVMAWDPRGETLEEFWAGAATRPLDTNRLIAYADTLTAPDGELAGVIDTEHIASTGHSSGGWSALAGGGAQMDFGWCAAHPDLVVEGSDCSQFPGHQEEIAAMLGLAAAPEGLWPPTNDPRVKAIVALAPDGDIWGAEYEGVAAVQVPTLVMAGSQDSVNIPEQAAYPIYEHLGSAAKSLVIFEGGSHIIFINQCRDIPWMMQDAYWFCADAVWDMDRVHDLINHVVTAFLLAELKGDADAAAALAPENVAFPGIQYETTAYGTAASVPTALAGLEAETVAEIETLVGEMMARTKLPGFALGIVKGGELVYAKGFGVTSLDGGEPVTPQTIFLWAENSMAPTAMAVLQLVEQGKIDLDAPVTDYLPYFRMTDVTYSGITIRHLLMNTSGIPDSGDTMADWENFMPEYDAGAVERWVRSLADTGLLFAPGAGFEYSAPGYALLGAVVGAASAQTYEEYMSENILEPLGMDKSTFLLEEVDKTLLSSPHVQDASGEMVVAKALPYHRPFAAANNLFANVDDMAKLAQASLNRGILDDQRILSKSAFEQMWEPHSPTPFADFPFGQIYPARMMIDWGYGWFIGDIAGHVAPNTLGNEYGFSAEMALAPDANVAVIAVGNGPPIDEYYAADMVADVMSILLK